jgi:hypothetical protein
MRIICRYKMVIAVVCFFFVYALGTCQEDKKEEITWEDIETTKTEPAQINLSTPQETKPAPEINREPLQVSTQAAPILKPKQEIKPEAKNAPVKKRVKKEEGKWKRATTITNEDPAANRDVFITNPNRE